MSERKRWEDLAWSEKAEIRECHEWPEKMLEMFIWVKTKAGYWQGSAATIPND